MSLKALIVTSLIVLLTQLRVCEVSGNKCGEVEFLDPKVVKGAATVKGQWPFLAALQLVEKAKFFCGATLISSKNLLTAAHCVQSKGSLTKLKPEDVVVLLGAYNLDRNEADVQERKVEEIYLHPEWKAFTDKYDADLAILVLREMVQFTRYIRPICLPGDDPPINAMGSIVGWGLSELSIANMLERESIPRQAYTRILNDSYCYTNQDFLSLFSSPRLFCGGGDGGSPNKGDSGGGLFVLSGSTWTQYGIISASLSDGRGFALPDSFSLYTNVRAFKSWIDETVVTTGGVVMSIEKVKINLTCSYMDPGDKVNYRCALFGVNVTSQYSEVDLVTGTHLRGYNVDNVTEIFFWSGTLKYIPEGIGKKFKYLNKFLVFPSSNTTRLERSNFKSMELLRSLNVGDNNIDTVDEDALMDLPNLESFGVNENKLKILHEKTFFGNGKLKHVSAELNELEFLPIDLFKNNPMLEEVNFQDNNLKIISIDFTHFSSIKKIDFHGNSCIDKALKDVDSLTGFQVLLNARCSGK